MKVRLIGGPEDGKLVDTPHDQATIRYAVPPRIDKKYLEHKNGNILFSDYQEIEYHVSPIILGDTKRFVGIYQDIETYEEAIDQLLETA